MKTIVIAISWIIFFSLFVYDVVLNPDNFFSKGTVLLGWFLFSVQISWTYSGKFYLLMKRIWFYLKNPVCYWNMDVEMKMNTDNFNLSNLDRTFRSQPKKLNTIEERSDIRRKYELEDFNIEVSTPSKGMINFDVQNLRVPYRYSESVIADQICVLFEDIQRLINSRSNFYGLTIEFQDINPYYGFFLRRLSERDIDNFQVVFNVDNEKVRVSKSRIEISASSLSKLNSLAKSYLTLSPR